MLEFFVNNLLVLIQWMTSWAKQAQVPFASDHGRINTDSHGLFAWIQRLSSSLNQSKASRTKDHKQTTTASKQYELFTPSGKMTQEYLQDIRSVVIDYLREMDIKYPTNFDHDYEFERYYVETAIQHGFPAELVLSKEFEIALRVGIDIALTTYGHLNCKVTQQYIGFYTSILTYLDDVLEHDASMIQDFMRLFTTGQPQKLPILDNLADHIRRAYDIWDGTRANLIIASTLDYMTTLLMDVDLKDMEVQPPAVNYPRWLRNRTGDATAYVLFIFPANIPLQDFIQVMPEMEDDMVEMNDILSFYKEEIHRESLNQISQIAHREGITKIQCMRNMLRDQVQRQQRTKAILSSKNPSACDIYTKHFLPGYVGLHVACSSRYKLDDLKIL